MKINPITEDYAVGPHIGAEDIAEVKAAGYTTVICNLPDEEVRDPSRSSAQVGAAAEAAGVRFVNNPFSHRLLTMQIVDAQGAAIDEGTAAGGRVFAYCASGNRCSILWALSQAGRRPTDELIDLPARAGYQIGQVRPQVEALAKARG